MKAILCVATFGILSLFLLVIPMAWSSPAFGQTIEGSNPLPSLSGQWDVIEKAMLGPDAPRIRELGMSAQLLSDGTRLLITWTEADTAFLQQAYTYSASVGEIQGVATGKDGLPRDEYGVFNVSTRTLTVFGKADLPDGSWSGWKTVWRFVSDDELQKRQYLVGSDGEEGLFSEAFCFRRG